MLTDIISEIEINSPGKPFEFKPDSPGVTTGFILTKYGNIHAERDRDEYGVIIYKRNDGDELNKLIRHYGNLRHKGENVDAIYISKQYVREI
jgi:hypothetical protein